MSGCNCPRCRGLTITAAEIMLNVVDTLMSDMDRIDDYSDLGEYRDLTIARVVVSLKFASMSKGFQLRAIVEEWDNVDLIREMY